MTVPAKKRKGEEKTKEVMSDFLTSVAEASYQVVTRWGFKGSFLAFLCDFQKELEATLGKKDPATKH